MPKRDKFEQRHIRNLIAFYRQIDTIYKEAANEAATIGSLVHDFNQEKPFSFSDFPQTKKRINRLLEDLNRNLSTTIVDGISTSWALANHKNNDLVHRVLGEDLGSLPKETQQRYLSTNPKALEAFKKRQIAGLNLSDRVWNYTNQFKTEIELGLDLGIRSGMAAPELAKSLKQYLRYPDKLFRRVHDEHGQLHLSKAAAAFHPGQGVYRSSYKNARRLAVTECNIAYRTADHLRYQELDFVVGIHIHISKENHPVRDICDDLEGRYPKDFKFTGWHPHCRCYVTSVLKTMEEIKADNQRILQGESPAEESENSVTDLPDKFKTWMVENQDRIETARERGKLPYFIIDNEKRSSVFMEDKIAPGIKINAANIPLEQPSKIMQKDVKIAIFNFANANPKLFRGGLTDVLLSDTSESFMSNGRKYHTKTGVFLAKDGNTIAISNKTFDIHGKTYNPYEELRGALQSIAERKKLSFNQEYAIEGLWHEIRHAAAVGWKSNKSATPILNNSVELINQFCARVSYPSFLQSLGGKATHARKVMEKGYGYSNSVSNFNILLKQMKVSKKAAYNHFKDIIIKTPYEQIHTELVRFIEKRGSYSIEAVEDIINNFTKSNKEFLEMLSMVR